MTRPLVALGVMLAALGVVMLLGLGASRTGPERTPLIGEEQARVEPPPRVWVVGGGLLLAAGAACIGLGMNKWRQHG